MYKIIQNLSEYTDSPRHLISLLAGVLLAAAMFNLVVVPVHNRIKYFFIKIFGDYTPFREGDVTMSPRTNVHIVGLVSSLIINIGFAAPTYYDDEKFKYPRLYTLIISLSGILTYFLFFAVAFFIYSVLGLSNLFGISSLKLETLDAGVLGCVYYAFFVMTYYLAITCIYSAIFNLIPLYPLDMGDVLYLFIPLNWSDALRNNELMVSLGLFVIAFLWLGTSKGFIVKQARVIMTESLEILRRWLGYPN